MPGGRRTAAHRVLVAPRLTLPHYHHDTVVLSGKVLGWLLIALTVLYPRWHPISYVVHYRVPFGT